MPSLRTLSIRSHLLLLVGLALLPALGILLLRNLEARRGTRLDLQRNCVVLVESLRAQEELGVESIRQLLATLARLPALRDPARRDLDQLLREAQQENPHLASLYVADLNGRIYAANQGPDAVDVSDRPYFRETLRTGRFTAGSCAWSRITGRPVLHFAHPVRDARGRICGVLGAGARLSRYEEMLALGRLPEGTRLTFLDRHGRVLHSSSPGQEVGSAFDAEALSRMRTGVAVGVLQEAVNARLVGFRHVALNRDEAPYLTIRAELPEGPALATAAAKLRQDLMFLGMGALAAGLMAWLLGEWMIVRRIRRLAQAAARYAEGDLSPRLGPTLGGGELGELAAAFDGLGHALAEREAERDRAEQERQRLQDRLQQSEKLEAIGQLAGGVAHDFNNQLAAIAGSAELLAQKLDEPDLRRRAERILKTCERSSDLTRKLLAFARKGNYRKETVELHAAVDEVAQLLEHSLAKSIRILQAPPTAPIFTQGDPHQLQNALLNLALNARDAMPEGGSIRFSVGETCLEARDLGRLRGDPVPGCYAVLSVEDEGCGMAPELLDHIFEPFFTTKGPGQGTGLGLASVYGTLQAHKGAIEVQSRPGQGTCFRLYLPKAPPPSAETRPCPPIQLSPDRGGHRILVVEDEPLVGELVKECLEGAGYRARHIPDGSRAVAEVQSQPEEVDLVLLDLVMPGMSGREVFHALRAIRPDLKVLLASGYARDGEAQDLLQAGALGFIAKPFRLAELREHVASCLAPKS